MKKILYLLLLLPMLFSCTPDETARAVEPPPPSKYVTFQVNGDNPTNVTELVINGGGQQDNYFYPNALPTSEPLKVGDKVRVATNSNGDYTIVIKVGNTTLPPFTLHSIGATPEYTVQEADLI